MAKNTKKELTISVLDIRNVELNPEEPKLVDDLYAILNATQTGRERLMPLSASKNNVDNDFITSFSKSSGFLFGAFARLTEGEESSVPKAVLDKKIISLNEMISEASKNSEGYISASCFFCIHGTLIALTHRQRMLKSLETYINWFLEKNNKPTIRLVPKMNKTTEVALKDIRSIQIADGFLNNLVETKSQSIKLKGNVLKTLLKDVKSEGEIELENIVDAVLTLKINRNELKKQKALETALKITDDENIVITDRKGKTIRGSECSISAVREFERLKNDVFNEKEIETEMRKILKDVEDGKMVN